MPDPSVDVHKYAGHVADDFTHLDSQGHARMVDVSAKDQTHRRATARCRVVMKPTTVEAIARHGMKKGDVLAVARVAGIQAAKRTSDAIPLCHPLMISSVHIEFELGDDFVDVEATVEVVGRTGVEMEALHAASISALTIYDMCKGVDRGISVTDLALWEKSGGKSGDFRRVEN